MFNGLTSGVSAKLADVTATSDLDTFLTTIKGGLADLTTANLGKILLAALGITVGLFLCWFGYRWVVRKVSGGIKKGKL